MAHIYWLEPEVGEEGNGRRGRKGGREEGRGGGVVEGWYKHTLTPTFTHIRTYTNASHACRDSPPPPPPHTHMHADTQAATHPPKRSLLSLCWLMLTTTSLCPTHNAQHHTSPLFLRYVCVCSVQHIEHTYISGAGPCKYNKSLPQRSPRINSPAYVATIRLPCLKTLANNECFQAT